MSRDRDDVDAEIVLPAGMELVVPPVPDLANPEAGVGDGEPGPHDPGTGPPDGVPSVQPRRSPTA